MVFLYKFIIYFSIFIQIVCTFTPDTSSFDVYGIKLAINDIFLVESISASSSFYLRLAPYNYSLSCTIPWNNSDQYIYAVALDRYATMNDSIRFVFIGVDTITDVPFIGLLTYAGMSGATYIAAGNVSRRTMFPCKGWETNNYRVHPFEQFTSDVDRSINNDFFVVTVGPTGQFAYAFTQNFLVVYDLARDTVFSQLGNSTWPNPSFLPRAVDVSRDLFFVVLGYIGDSSSNYTPCAYLLNITDGIFTILDVWLYTPPIATSWQASLTNWDADVYASKYDMSVSIDDAGDQILFGIQITNTILLLGINRTNRTFGSSIQTLSNGKAIGMGKALGWLDTHLILILVNMYSFTYIWSSSQIFAYNVTVANNFAITFIFPNMQQVLAPTFGPILLSLVVTQNGTVGILDSNGNYYILQPSPVGYFSDSSSGKSSSSSLCIGGTFAPKMDIVPCSLCPSGTTTNGLIGQSSCVLCNPDAFCPLQGGPKVGLPKKN